MYQEFQNIRTFTRTRTNARLFLDDPKAKDGKFTKYVNVFLEGTMEVFTDPLIFSVWEDIGPLYVLPWHVGEMPSEGKSDIGVIKMWSTPGLVTTGVIRQNTADQKFPATLDAAVFQTLDVPGYGKLHNKYPVMVRGTVDAIPPFHTEAKCTPALLFDERDKPRGVAAGRSLTLLGPA